MKYNVGDVIITISDEQTLLKKFTNKVGIILECNSMEERTYTYRILLCGMKEELRYGKGTTWMAEQFIKEALYKSEG
jgi:hypothetical protein